jgi:hypothetical protein
MPQTRPTPAQRATRLHLLHAAALRRRADDLYRAAEMARATNYTDPTADERAEQLDQRATELQIAAAECAHRAARLHYA